jgi:tRNA A37 methylthiotransferase MiaB
VLENKLPLKTVHRKLRLCYEFSDSGVASILSVNGYNTTQVLEEADLVLVNTCSIRDKAEQTAKTFREVQCCKTN